MGSCPCRQPVWPKNTRGPKQTPHAPSPPCTATVSKPCASVCLFVCIPTCMYMRMRKWRASGRRVSHVPALIASLHTPLSLPCMEGILPISYQPRLLRCELRAANAALDGRSHILPSWPRYIPCLLRTCLSTTSQKSTRPPSYSWNSSNTTLCRPHHVRPLVPRASPSRPVSLFLGCPA